MKILDYIIAALVVGCMFVGYSGYRLIATLLLILVFILASWRFYDRDRGDEIGSKGGSGELNPELDEIGED